ncbi:uncharacterized protein LOC133832416 [Humulus lupulus]|uniref:uncharacterized protein LOC133832416 n=1 Tax=Humulus lupulus TaxID=3486 RepID=UPI002B40AE8D|nr:uncharacterized protein LOC133832416 [Humulus lupulus]
MEKSGALTSWDVFLQELHKRFGTSVYDDPLGKIAKLTQIGSVTTYRAEFERLMIRIIGVEETMFINFFVWGLNLDIRRELLLSTPTNLADAMAKAQLFGDRHEDLKGRHRAEGSHHSFGNWRNDSSAKVSPKPSVITSHSSGSPSTHRSTSTTPSLSIKRLSLAELKECRDKGLCFTCDENFSFNHQCRNRVLIMCGTEDDVEDDIAIEPAVEDVTQEEVSLHSLSNSSHPHIFRMLATHRATKLEVLIDTGSNSNFIQEDLASKLNLPMVPVKKFKVYMGNGQFLTCSSQCQQVELILQGHQFVVDLFVLPIWGLDVVLGMQWLRTLGPCLHNHKDLTIEFQWNGQIVRLEGNTPVSAQLASCSQLHSFLGAEHGSLLFCLFVLADPSPDHSADLSSLEAQLPPCDKTILKDFSPVFATPLELPPWRTIDHRIHLREGSTSVNVRPYRYPYFQKDVMEKLVREMLDYGFIRHSNNPNSSPVLLVKKKDGTWCFCVDYSTLNAITIPDRFPITTIDDLLDELGGATVFSKLDLRSGYHQIRMAKRDIHKTTFRTHEGHYEFVVMPFGLSNAPSTFQANMNQVFRPYLRRFVIVFFDDILVYNKTISAHVEHLCILQCLATHHFFSKASKCSLFRSSIDFLGHLVSREGVRDDPSKIAAMVKWPQPHTLKQLCGFLGLTGYYRSFVSHYTTIAAPLIELLKRDNFKWTSQVATTFASLKDAMIFTPVLKVPNFSKTLIVETDASQEGIGGVLMQDGHPLAFFFSKKLGPRLCNASAYVRELRAVVEVVTKWCQYLLGCFFIIRTDHCNLRDLLSQTNAAADTLSRCSDSDSTRLSLAFSSCSFDFLAELQVEYNTHDDVLRIRHQLLQDLTALPLISRHADFVSACTICQSVKYSIRAPYGLLQPLPIPERVWEDLAMDFIVGLPLSQGYLSILVVVDRLTKYAHFGPLPRHYTATKVADLFSQMVIKLQGLSKSIVSDRDPIFTSAFWRKLFVLMGTTLKTSSSYHPQTDGQTTNRYLEQYLRAFTTDNSKQWSCFLSWAEYHYNTSYHSSIAMSPFQAHHLLF